MTTGQVLQASANIKFEPITLLSQNSKLDSRAEWDACKQHFAEDML
jgi:hypothetical protein